MHNKSMARHLWSRDFQKDMTLGGESGASGILTKKEKPNYMYMESKRSGLPLKTSCCPLKWREKNYFLMVKTFFSL